MHAGPADDTVLVGKVTADSGIDALTHAIEAYTAVDNADFPLPPGERTVYQGKHPMGDLCAEIEDEAIRNGFSVVREFVGHGVGRKLHEEPQIPNYGKRGSGPKLKAGMTLAIEPMITAGGPDVYLHDDEWSISTADGSLAAHFEHTVAIVEEGPPRILTAAKSREKAGLVP